ncbi:MAG TPA: hypothetical protein VD978_33560 [Azospirillum sp.]|nr:hypothetical protein [Azospirillum sp.]
MDETQAKIAAWAAAEFGSSMPIRIAARAFNEVAELLAVYSAPTLNRDALIEEAADIAIVLSRLDLILNDDEPQWDSLVTSGETQLTTEYLVGSVAQGIADIIRLLIEQDRDGAALACESVLSDLADLVAWFGGDLPTAIDAKMAVNRKRVWKRSADGHGFHTHEEAVA